MKNKAIDFKFLGKIGNYLSQNAATVSMVGGIVGLVGALYAAFKASDEVSEIHKEYDDNVKVIKSSALSDDEKAKEIKELKTMRNLRYICAEKYTIVLGVGSAAGTFLTNYFNGITIAGLTALVAAKQDEIRSFAENAKKVVGEEQFEKIKDMTLEDKVLRNFVDDDGRKAVKTDPYSGDLFIDTDTGVMFQIDKRDLLEVLERAEDYCKRNHVLYRDKFFEMLGIEPPTNSKTQCWGPKNPFKAHIGNRTFHGMTIQSIEYEHIPQLPKWAGVPKV